MPVTVKIPGKAITVIRSKLNVTQVGLASLLSMSASQVSAWESGACPVGGTAWLTMCLLAGESPNWLPTKQDLVAAEAWKKACRQAILARGREGKVAVAKKKKKVVAKKRK